MTVARPPSTFDARLAELARRVGSGRLVGSVERDQAYAQYQHEGIELRHPQGGQAKYQEQALLGGHRDYLQHLADHVLDGGLVDAMAQVMERLDDESAALTPRDTTVLARSGAPVVRSAGRVVWSRPPQVPRLSDVELADLRRAGVRGV